MTGTLEKLEDLEIAFHMAEKAYSKDTLNFEIMEELHRYSSSLLVDAQKKKINPALDQIGSLVKALRTMSETRRKARKSRTEIFDPGGNRREGGKGSSLPDEIVFQISLVIWS